MNNQITDQVILVAEDDLDILELIQIILENAGFKVHTISNGAHVQSTVRQIMPNLILMDAWMPGGDGRDITKKLKKDPLTKDIPIIMVSALTNIKQFAKESCADDYIAKPFDIDVLIQKVRQLV